MVLMITRANLSYSIFKRFMCEFLSSFFNLFALNFLLLIFVFLII